MLDFQYAGFPAYWKMEMSGGENPSAFNVLVQRPGCAYWLATGRGGRSLRHRLGVLAAMRTMGDGTGRMALC